MSNEIGGMWNSVKNTLGLNDDTNTSITAGKSSLADITPKITAKATPTSAAFSPMKPKERLEYWYSLLKRYKVTYKVFTEADGFGFSSELRMLYIPEGAFHNRLLMVYALHELAHYVLGHEDTEDENIDRNNDFAAWAWALARMKESLTWPEIQFALQNLDFPKIKAR